MKFQRIKQLEDYLKQHKSVSLDTLCEIFNVSKNTIRRDIDFLYQEGKLQKVYGGVLYLDKQELIPISERTLFLTDEKKKIAQRASEIIQDNDIILIDAGSTTSHIVPFLQDKKNITIITNSLIVINQALYQDNCKVISCGGDLLKETCSFIGIEAIQFLSKLNAHKAFIGASGLSLDNGITNSSIIEAEIKKTMINISAKKYLMVDHTKFDISSLVTFAVLDDFDGIITDKKPPREYGDLCRTKHINLNIVQ